MNQYVYADPLDFSTVRFVVEGTYIYANREVVSGFSSVLKARVKVVVGFSALSEVKLKGRLEDVGMLMELLHKPFTTLLTSM